jgi:hypothetical protein
MGLKRENDSPASKASCVLDGVPDQTAMAEVQPIEIPHGNDGTGQW